MRPRHFVVLKYDPGLDSREPVASFSEEARARAFSEKAAQYTGSLFSVYCVPADEDDPRTVFEALWESDT